LFVSIYSLLAILLPKKSITADKEKNTHFLGGTVLSKQQVLAILKENTQALGELTFNELLTTEGISELVAIRRNTTSQYLNEFVKEGLAIKVKSRPAVFFDKEAFSQLFFKPSQSVYDNLEQLKNEENSHRTKTDLFADLIGAKTSLRMAVDQLKASVFYPGIGLPVMLHGETGVGKSLLARKTYEFCIDQQLIHEEAPFHELNCAQYYHNQELLSSILFGYKKGAFTGADSDQVGLLEASDGGILFLDECHRLSPESQEKLFTFIDTQQFSRIGENNITRKSQVRLIFATTEDVQTNFLRTFLRRVPITIHIPALKERTPQEISEYIYTFFINESRNFNRPILITPWIINRLSTLNYQDNVGELKNIIKVICANAFSKRGMGPSVLVNSETLEDHLLSRFLSLKEVDSTEKNDVLVTPESVLTDFLHKETDESLIMAGIFKVYEKIFQQYQQGEVETNYLIQQLSREANTVIEMLVFQTVQEKNTLLLLQNTIKELVNFLESNYFVKISGNSIMALTNYLYKRSNFFDELPSFKPKTIVMIKDFLNMHMQTEQKILNALLELVESKLDLQLLDSEKILLTFYLKGLDIEIRKPEVRGLILAHGFSTASSIADVVNRFMDEHLFDSFDMPFNVPANKVQEFVKHYIKENDCSKGLIILADMGSLMILDNVLKDQLEGPLLIMNNVNTQQALFVGDMVKKKTDFERIGQRIQEELIVEYRLAYPKKTKQALILTVCHTGLGAAQQLKEFLSTSLPKEIDYAVEAVDYHFLKKYGKDNQYFKQFDVQGIVGTADPEIEGVDYVALEDLISGSGKEQIDKLFKQVADPAFRKDINDNLVRNLSIERLVSVITILDVKRVIGYIDEAIIEMERNLKITMENSKKAILYIHIAGLVERMIRNQEVSHYQSTSHDEQRQRRIKAIATSLQILENAYNIKISEYELDYLYDIIFEI
jgi:sigma-54 dependent transcriptional regulator of gfr operon